jgi:hypothetical protein
VPDADATAANRENVAPRHLDANVRQRDAETEIRRHRALASQQPLEQRIRFQIRKLLDAYVEQLLQRPFQIEALQIDDAAPGNDFVEAHSLRKTVERRNGRKKKPNAQNIRCFFFPIFLLFAVSHTRFFFLLFAGFFFLPFPIFAVWFCLHFSH